MRCPECGGDTSILESIQRRRRREQEGHLLFRLTAGIFAIVTLLYLVADGRIPGLHMGMVAFAAIAGVLIYLIGVRVMFYRIHVHEIALLMGYLLALFTLSGNDLIGSMTESFLRSLGVITFLGVVVLREWRTTGDRY